MKTTKGIVACAGFTLLITLFGAVSLLGAQAGIGQLPRLRGTIKDPSGAAMPSVDIAVLEGARVVKAVKTDATGVFSFEIAAGQYQIAVAAPDFKTYTQPVRVTQNMPALVVTLSLEGITAVVDVVEDTQKVAVDAALSLDATTLTADQIKDLPEDEASLLELLQALAGGQGNAQVIIDGFEGGRMPTRDQIASIVIEPNSFNATGTGPRITIVSRTPGPTRWAGGATFQYRDSALNARNPGTESKTPSRRSVFSTNYNGPVIKGKLGMTINLSKEQSEASNNSIRAITPGGPVNKAIFSPSTYDNIGISSNWYFSQTHTMLNSFNYNRSKNLNSGVGGFALEERASDGRNSGWNIQISDNKTLSPRMTNTFQFRMNRNNSSSTPRTDAVAINVLDAFYGGGAQNLSESRGSTFNLSNTLRWTPQDRLNIQFNLSLNRQSNYNYSESNYLGTFTFSSLADYLAGIPITFTQTSGEPVARFAQSDASVSMQVTYRIKPTMSYSAGAQYSIQSHLKDYNNFSPTMQLQTQLNKRTILSVGARMTHPTAGFPLFSYEQLIRGDGTTRQFSTVISNPTYPDAFAGGVSGITSGVGGNSLQMRDEHLESPYTINTQVSLNESLPKNWRITTTFGLNRSVHQLRNRNINAPFPGTPLDPTLTRSQIDQLRPFYPNVARINKFESIGNSFSKNLSFTVQVPSTKKILKTQISGAFQYGLTWTEDDGAWQNPYDIRADWAPNDQRHRLQGTFSIRPPKAGSFSLNVNATSGRAYSITTGKDDNFDQSINDRPAGVARNSLRGPGFYTMNLTWSSPALDFRRKKQETPALGAAPGTPGAPAAAATPAAQAAALQESLLQSAMNAGLPPAAIQQLLATIALQPGLLLGSGITPTTTPTTQPSLAHPRMTFNVNVRNLLNNTTANGYVGVITSDLFGQPTSYGMGRQIMISLSSQF